MLVNTLLRKGYLPLKAKDNHHLQVHHHKIKKMIEDIFFNGICGCKTDCRHIQIGQSCWLLHLSMDDKDKRIHHYFLRTNYASSVFCPSNLIINLPLLFLCVNKKMRVKTQ